MKSNSNCVKEIGATGREKDWSVNKFETEPKFLEHLKLLDWDRKEVCARRNVKTIKRLLRKK